MIATEKYIQVLSSLQNGDLSLLRSHAGCSLYESVDAFDLFAGLWWPLRQKDPKTPRRGAAWLIAKLYAYCPIEQDAGALLAVQLARCRVKDNREANRRRRKFDELLMLPFDRIEPALQWALDTITSSELKLDWVRLTDDLSIWRRPNKRRQWAEQYLPRISQVNPCKVIRF